MSVSGMDGSMTGYGGLGIQIPGILFLGLGLRSGGGLFRLSGMWTTVREYEDIRYETTDAGKIAKITINRPAVRNAFRPKTVKELLQAFDHAHEDHAVG